MRSKIGRNRRKSRFPDILEVNCVGFITSEQVDQYLTNLMPIDDPLLAELQEEGIAKEIPIIQVPSLRLIQLMLKIIQPKVMIEVGTAIGFSTIWLAKSFPETIIHSIERNPQMAEHARRNIDKACLIKQIILHEGEAFDIFPQLPKTKFIFIDAAKGKYKDFFNLSYPLLEAGGIMVFDNILFRGYVADEAIVKTKPMLRKIRKFNDFLANQNKVETSFIPIGDGLAICYKMEDID